MKKPALAILAPVPLMHLESGLDVCRVRGSVIFGSDRFSLFDDRGVQEGAPVHIYASITGDTPRSEVSWRANFVRYWRHEELGREQRRRRPPTTDETDTPWVGYWEVRDLEQLDEAFPITDLLPEEGGRFSPAFIPQGPIAVAG